MTSLGTRVKAAREAANISQKALAALIGVSEYTVMRLEKGRREAGTAEIEKIAAALHVSVEYLMGLSNAGTPTDVTVLTPQQIRRVDVPLLSAEITACCGAGIPTYNEIQNPPSEVYKYTIEEIGGSYDDMRPPFAVRADGACLEKSRIFDGDVLIVNPALTPRQGQICVVNWEGALSAKRVVRNADGSITLHSDADTYAISAEAAANPVHFSIWGVVVASRRAIR